MELSELTAYAKEKYGIREERGYQSFPNCSVLSHPRTGGWIAFLMRQWDMELGMELERCDIRCGQEHIHEFKKDYLSPPIRMHGLDWIGVALDKGAESDVVFKLLDYAVAFGEPREYTVVLNPVMPQQTNRYQDTPLPFFGSLYRPQKEVIPERIRKMRQIGRAGIQIRSTKELARFFRRQALFMQDYEDDFPWQGEFFNFYSTYRDMNTKQLRGYFAWRTNIRKGIFNPIPTAAAFIYIYELFNGIGASSPEESLRKLREFEVGYLDSGIGDRNIRTVLHRSMLEFAIIKNLPLEVVRQYADPEKLSRDEALAVLWRSPGYSNEEVFSALCYFAKKKLTSSPVLNVDGDRGKQLFSEIWRKVALKYREKKECLFTLCFGKRRTFSWFPLNSIVYDWGVTPKDMDYRLSESRIYRCRNGAWTVDCFENLYFDRDMFLSLIHAADLRLRRYFKTGRYLRDSKDDAWALPFVDEVIHADEQAVMEASKPKITIDMNGLDKIRKDAIATRNSLLTEEELAEIEPSVKEPAPAQNASAESCRSSIPASADSPMDETGVKPDIPLDAVQIQILRILLRGESVLKIVKKNRLMPSMVADAINEALFDEIGDTVLSCEDDMLSIVEDYRDDISQMLGENKP